MNKATLSIIIALFAASLLGGALFVFKNTNTDKTVTKEAFASLGAKQLPFITSGFEKFAPIKSAVLDYPISNALARVTKKPFGILIGPGNSPVPNDHFSGYHVGVDFEIFENEKDIDVPIYSICDGPLLFKKQASGYGGVAVQKCRIREKEVSVIYGHLKLKSIIPESGKNITKGERIGILGAGESEETDGVRKHLHLGIHEGSVTDIRGYVKDEAELQAWSDALQYLQNR